MTFFQPILNDFAAWIVGIMLLASLLGFGSMSDTLRSKVEQMLSRRNKAYFRAVIRHKWFVFKACRKLGVPLWSAILHDWDKFEPDEFFPYAQTFYKVDGSGQYVETVDFAHAWMLHQHRNKHHWQYWVWVKYENFLGRIRENHILVWDRGVPEHIVWRNDHYEIRSIENYQMTAEPMPHAARLEMLADWFGAGQSYKQDWTPLEPRIWYEKNRDKMIFHPDTRTWVESALLELEKQYLKTLE